MENNTTKLRWRGAARPDQTAWHRGFPRFPSPPWQNILFIFLFSKEIKKKHIWVCGPVIHVAQQEERKKKKSPVGRITPKSRPSPSASVGGPCLCFSTLHNNMEVFYEGLHSLIKVISPLPLLLLSFLSNDLFSSSSVIFLIILVHFPGDGDV